MGPPVLMTGRRENLILTAQKMKGGQELDR